MITEEVMSGDDVDGILLWNCREHGTFNYPNQPCPMCEDEGPYWLRMLQKQLLREAAEATVALSHEPDCDCHICQRVRERNRKREERAGD